MKITVELHLTDEAMYVLATKARQDKLSLEDYLAACLEMAAQAAVDLDMREENVILRSCDVCHQEFQFIGGVAPPTNFVACEDHGRYEPVDPQIKRLPRK